MLLLLLLGFAAYRITRLITKDTFPPVAKLRAKLVGADELKLVNTRWEWFGELMTCYWCASVWIAGALVLAADLTVGGVPYPWLAWPAVAAFAALTAHYESCAEELVTRAREDIFGPLRSRQ